MFEDAQTFFQKTLALGPNLIEAYFELGRAYWFNGQRDEAVDDVEGADSRRTSSIRGESGAPRCSKTVEAGGRAVAADVVRRAAALVAIALCWRSRRRGAAAQRKTRRSRLDAARFTARVLPERANASRASLLDRAVANDTFPGLPRPTQHVLIAIAPDERRFREWVGPGAPEWGAAVAFPESRRIVMQGRSARRRRGRPARGTAARARASRAARVARRLAAALVRRGLCELRGARDGARRRAWRRTSRSRVAGTPTLRRARQRILRRGDDGADGVRARLSRGRSNWRRSTRRAACPASSRLEEGGHAWTARCA